MITAMFLTVGSYFLCFMLQSEFFFLFHFHGYEGQFKKKGNTKSGSSLKVLCFSEDMFVVLSKFIFKDYFL